MAFLSKRVFTILWCSIHFCYISWILHIWKVVQYTFCCAKIKWRLPFRTQECFAFPSNDILQTMNRNLDTSKKRSPIALFIQRKHISISVHILWINFKYFFLGFNCVTVMLVIFKNRSVNPGLRDNTLALPFKNKKHCI